MIGWAKLYFKEFAPVREWLNDGCPLMPGFRVEAFGDGEDPSEGTEFELGAFRRYLEAREYSGAVFGSNFTIYYSHSTHYRAPPALFECEFVDPTVCRELAPLFLRWFESRGSRYGFACLDEELFERNLFKYYLPVPGTRRPSTVMLGKDINRYVPGLYWLNYFSEEYARAHGIDVAQLAIQLDGNSSRLARGWLLELYEHPAIWPEKAAAVRGFLSQDSRFFSLTRVPQLPRLTLRDSLRFVSDLERQYP